MILSPFSLFSNYNLICGFSEAKDGVVHNNGDINRFDDSLLESLENKLGIERTHFFSCEQIHGTKIAIIDSALERQAKSVKACDSLITPQKHTLLLIKHADCLPVFFYDPDHQVVGIAHSGWKGTKGKIAVSALEAMNKNYGTQMGSVLVGIGPGARECCYTFQKGSEKDILSSLPDWKPYIRETADHITLNLAGFITQTLLERGVEAKHIEDVNICSIHNPHFCSWTRQHREGETLQNGISFVVMP